MWGGLCAHHNENSWFPPYGTPFVWWMGQSLHYGFHRISDRSRQDISNHYFIPSSGAYVSLKGEKRFLSHIDTCEVSTCYFLTSDSLRLTASVNGGEAQPFSVDGKEELQSVSVNGRIGSVRWKVEQLDSTALFYAVTMDPRQGVVVDNFSTRGSSGQQLG